MDPYKTKQFAGSCLQKKDKRRYAVHSIDNNPNEFIYLYSIFVY